MQKKKGGASLGAGGVAACDVKKINPQTDLAWGTTENYLSYISERVNVALHSMDVAATSIQNWWRRQYSRRDANMLGRISKPEKIWNELAGIPVIASIKYDGTNVGVDEDGLCYGRRHFLERGQKQYQNTSLKDLYTVDVGKVKAEINRLLALQLQLHPPNPNYFH